MSESQIRVLHVMSGFGGGISSFIFNKAKEMKKYNIQFDVITYDECADYFVNAIHSTGGKIYRMVNPKTEGWHKFNETFTKPLMENQYDFIHCHITGVRVIPYYLLAKKHSEAKFYTHAHSSIIYGDLSKSGKIKAQTDQMINRRASLSPLGCGVKAIRSIYGTEVEENDMMIIPNSIDLEDFVINDSRKRDQLRKTFRETYGIKTDELVIGHIGRLRAIKNHEKTFEIAQELKKQNIKFKMLIIGEGERLSELEGMVIKYGLEDVIIFTGRINPISELYPALDLVILPSFSEGLPTVVVEAQVAGVPVILSDTITTEVDLGLGMLKFEPVEGAIPSWVEAIKESTQLNILSPIERKEAAENKKFSNEASAGLYADFLRGNIKHFTIS